VIDRGGNMTEVIDDIIRFIALALLWTIAIIIEIEEERI